jgi:hypothetical protein
MSLAALALAAPAAAQASNWEASGTRQGSFDRTAGAARWLVVMAPDRCVTRGKVSRSTAPLTVRPRMRIRDGRFRYSLRTPFNQTTFSGRFTSARRAVVTYRRQLQIPDVIGTGPTRCDTGQRRLTLQPAPRQPVQPGSWKGTGANGQPVELFVDLGGRLVGEALVKRPHPSFQWGAWSCDGNGRCSSRDTCAAQLGEYLFIRPDGAFSNQPGLNPDQVSGRFTAANAVAGDFARSTASCGAAWSAAPAP